MKRGQGWEGKREGGTRNEESVSGRGSYAEIDPHFLFNKEVRVVSRKGHGRQGGLRDIHG